MNEEQNQKELRIRKSSIILNYIKQFSATEKVLFGGLFFVALISATIMFYRANDIFMTPVPAKGGELREGVVGLPRNINPVLAISDTDRDLSSLIYAGLTRYEKDTIVPNIAKSWTVSKDGLIYDFVIRKDAKFSDGKPISASDIVFTIQKIQDPALKSPRRADWTNVTVTEISPTQVRFVLKQPYIPFITNTTIGILPKHIWNTINDDQFIFSKYNTEPVGAGPYKIKDIKKNGENIPVSYHIKSWKRHSGEAYISDIIFYFFTDQNEALRALNDGVIDSLALLTPSVAKELSKNTNQPYAILTAPLPRLFGIFLNQNQNPILAEKSIRQALEKSVNRQSIINVVLSGYGSPITGPLSDFTKNKEDDFAGDIIGAQAILEKTGWKKNNAGIYEKKDKKGVQILAFDIYTADTSELRQTADIVKSAWTNLGAKIDIKTFESSDLYQNIIRTRKYDTLLFGELIGKDRDLYAFWHSSQRNAPGLNIAQYVNSTADNLLEIIRSSDNQDNRNKAYKEFEKIIRADLPAIFLYASDFIYAVPKILRGIDIDSISISSDRWNSVTNWYIKTEKVWKIFAK